jgi:excisionase family DNA binding protein
MAIKLLSAEEVAETLNVSEQRVHEIAREGLCPAVVRIGRQVRFHPAKLDAWLEFGSAVLPGDWRREPLVKDTPHGPDDQPLRFTIVSASEEPEDAPEAGGAP